VIGDEQIEALITKTLEERPANGDTHWSTRSMAAQTELNQTRDGGRKTHWHPGALHPEQPAGLFSPA